MIGKLLATGMVTLAVGLAAGPATTRAADYTFDTCRTPAGGWASTAAWVITRRQSITKVSDSCPNGALDLTMDGTKTHAADEYLNATFRPPPDTKIRAFSIWRSIQLASTYNYRIWEINPLWDGGQRPVDVCLNVPGSCPGRGSPNLQVSPVNYFQDTPPAALDALRISVTCGFLDDSPEICPATLPGGHLQVYRADFTLEDDQDPILESPPSGPLVDPSKPALSGLQPVSLSATDRGGGVYQAEFEVDGQIVDREVIDRNSGSCQEPFDQPQPCKNSASGTVLFNTATVPDGFHNLRILVTDATGENAAAYGPITIRTANASCNPDPRSNSLNLLAQFKRRHRAKRSITVPYGATARVAGRLLDRAGVPLANSDVCVSELARMLGAQLTPTASLKTDGRGHFNYRPTRGPSRTLFFVHRVSGGAVASSVNLKVRAPIKLRQPRRSLRNGQTLVMQGHLGEQNYTTSGLLIELQAQRGRRHFQTFGTTHTNNQGQFRFAYQFTRTLGVQKYHLRAQIPAQETYPFATGWSHPITVKVIGPH
jgi:hypothetical protein